MHSRRPRATTVSSTQPSLNVESARKCSVQNAGRQCTSAGVAASTCTALSTTGMDDVWTTAMGNSPRCGPRMWFRTICLDGFLGQPTAVSWWQWAVVVGRSTCVFRMAFRISSIAAREQCLHRAPPCSTRDWKTRLLRRGSPRQWLGRMPRGRRWWIATEAMPTCIHTDGRGPRGSWPHACCRQQMMASARSQSPCSQAHRPERLRSLSVWQARRVWGRQALLVQCLLVHLVEAHCGWLPRMQVAQRSFSILQVVSARLTRHLAGMQRIHPFLHLARWVQCTWSMAVVPRGQQTHPLPLLRWDHEGRGRRQRYLLTPCSIQQRSMIAHSQRQPGPTGKSQPAPLLMQMRMRVRGFVRQHQMHPEEVPWMLRHRHLQLLPSQAQRRRLVLQLLLLPSRHLRFVQASAIATALAAEVGVLQQMPRLRACHQQGGPWAQGLPCLPLAVHRRLVAHLRGMPKCWPLPCSFDRRWRCKAGSSTPIQTLCARSTTTRR
mmetsp:Transcript_14165/g.45288  ORF Transcript_14165/g.45288 Transcript_14165/m.45288 type:complete len:492 (+) Transcript_14165:832-2307(+)